MKVAGPKLFCARQILHPKIFGSNRNFVPKKNFESIQNFGEKKFGFKKIVGMKNFW